MTHAWVRRDRDCEDEANHVWEHCECEEQGPEPHDFCIWCEAQVKCRHT